MKHYFIALVTMGFLFAGAAGCGDDGGDPTPDAAVDAVDAAAGTADAAADTADASGMLLDLFEVCTASSDCASDLCYAYGEGGMLCTQMCTTDADCPAPSPGCNMMGICRRPQ